MKVTLSQLKMIIESSINEDPEASENEDENIDPLTVEDKEKGVKAILSYLGNDRFKLVINDRELKDDPKKIAAVVTKAFLDLPSYTADNPADKDYRMNLNKIINKTIDNGVDGLKDVKQNRLVIWNSILQKIGRGKNRNS